MPRLTKFLWIGCALAAALSGRGAAAAEKIVWDIALYGPPREVTTQIEYVAKYVEEKSNGNFIFKLHYGESIAPAKAMLDSLKIGAVQGAFVTFTYVPGKTPLHLALDLPYLPVPDLDTWQKVQEKFYAWEPIKKELEKWNGIALYATLLPPYEFMGTGKPPKTLDDWKGMRVRALGPHGDAMRTTRSGAHLGPGARGLHRTGTRHVSGSVVSVLLFVRSLPPLRSIQLVHDGHAVRDREQRLGIFEEGL